MLAGNTSLQSTWEGWCIHRIVHAKAQEKQQQCKKVSQIFNFYYQVKGVELKGEERLHHNKGVLDIGHWEYLCWGSDIGYDPVNGQLKHERRHRYIWAWLGCHTRNTIDNTVCLGSRFFVFSFFMSLLMCYYKLWLRAVYCLKMSF